MTALGSPNHRVFLGLAIPNVLSNLSVPLAGLIDLALLGHLEDITPLAGVALAGLIFDFVFLSFGFLRMGTTGLTAIARGKNDLQLSAGIFFRSAMIALAIGVVLVAAQQLIGWVGFSLLRGETAVETSGRAYFYARIWGAPAALLGYVTVGWLLGRHHPRLALVFALVLNGTNIVLDYWFIFKLGLGAAGAGYATMLAEYGAMLVGLGLVWWVWRDHPGLKQIKLIDREQLRALIGLQGNIMIRSFCLIATFASFTNLSATFGTMVLAGNALLLRLLSTAAYFIDGFAFALESLAGQYFGSERWRDLFAALKMALVWNLVAVVLFLGMFLVTGENVLGMLTEHREPIEEALKALPYVYVVLLFSGVAYILDGFFIGMAQGKVLRNSMVLATLVGFVPLAALAVILNRADVLWWAMTTFMVMRAGTLCWVARQRWHTHGLT